MRFCCFKRVEIMFYQEEFNCFSAICMDYCYALSETWILGDLKVNLKQILLF